MRPASALLALLLSAMLAGPASCARRSRTEMREERLETFRQALPAEIRARFDEIGSEADCSEVGHVLAEARMRDPLLDARLDSIAHAELIDTFSETEMVSYFWTYFDRAVERGTVWGP